MAFEDFIEAQDRVIAQVRAELSAGEKRSHWMWFVFPQLAGLGSSAMAVKYAIADLDQAKAYAAHEVVGARLRECVGLVNVHAHRTAHQILGSPDDMKFRSCLTLFWLATHDPLFKAGLDQFYSGELDPMTVQLLA